MPFKSKSQRKWMHAKKPEMAKRWEKETPKGKSLPSNVVSKKGDTKKSHHDYYFSMDGPCHTFQKTVKNL